MRAEHDVERLVYHFLMNCFWNDELDAEANAAITMRGARLRRP